MENTKTTLNPVAQKRKEELRSILILLKGKIDDMADDVRCSSELLEIGMETSLIAQIEKILNEPVQMIIEASQDLEHLINRIVSQTVEHFFKSKKELLKNTYRITNTSNKLTYAIVLENDNFDNRMEIFSFFDMYDLSDFSRKFPVKFHFVPMDIENEIISKELIDIN